MYNLAEHAIYFRKAASLLFPARRGPGEPPSTRERRVQGAVEGSFICSSGGGLPFLLPARGPLTSPLLLLANCDAADTLVMFSASFVRPLPAPQPAPPPCRAHHIRNRRWWTRKTWNSTANLLCLWDPSTSAPSLYDGIRRKSAKPPSSSSSREGRWFWFEIQLDSFFFFFFGTSFSKEVLFYR